VSGPTPISGEAIMARTTAILALALSLLGWITAVPASVAFAPQGALATLGDEDRDALETIAAYPEEARDAVLEAALHPETLVEMELIQARSSEAFRRLLAARLGEGRDAQRGVWDLVRQPGLIGDLAEGGRKSPSQLRAIAQRYPEELEPTILEFGGERHELLVEIQELGLEADREFAELIAPTPLRAQAAFRELVDRPELVSILARHVRLTVLLGDAYRADRPSARQSLDRLSEEVARRNRRAGEEWTRSLSNDSEAMAELEEAAAVYAEEEGYEVEELTDPEVTVHVSLHVDPYPYWYGYPHWYAHLGIYRYGYWYPVRPHLGFYYAPHHHGVVFFGLPSHSFLHWYFASQHHHSYTHLSHHFVRHHERHAHARGHFHRSLARWVKRRDHRAHEPSRHRRSHDRRVHESPRQQRLRTHRRQERARSDEFVATRAAPTQNREPGREVRERRASGRPDRAARALDPKPRRETRERPGRSRRVREARPRREAPLLALAREPAGKMPRAISKLARSSRRAVSSASTRRELHSSLRAVRGDSRAHRPQAAKRQDASGSRGKGRDASHGRRGGGRPARLARR
jgi:hypothetical protein